MPIKKREKPAPPPVIKPSPKQKWRNSIDDLAIGLQQDAHAVFKRISREINVSYHGVADMNYVALCLMERVTCNLFTLQMNYPDKVSYRAAMTWENREAKPKHGYIFPMVSAVIVSPSMALSVMLAYLEICKQAGKLV